MTPEATACPRCHLAFMDGELFCPRDGARLVAQPDRDDDPLVGGLLAERYRVVRRIGEGGMGKVYEAQHVVLDKPVALKVLREDFSHRPEVVARFRQEARAASRIGHPHIVDVSDFGVTQSGAHFFVMELLVGHDLALELEREGTLPTRRALQIVLQCAEALAAAHAKGIVHRDVKPENLFLVEHESGSDFVKLVDFGIAKILDAELASSSGSRKLTQTGVVFGTPEYMAPELALGQSADHRVDAYALGVILYELIAGRPPFLGDTFMGVLAQHAGDPIPSLADVNPACFAPPALERLLARALAKRPDDRHPSMAAFAEEVAQLLESLTLDPPRSIPPGTITHAPRAIEPGRISTLAAPSVPPPSGAQPLWMRAGIIVLLCALGALVVRELRAHRVVRPDEPDAVPVAAAPAVPPLPTRTDNADAPPPESDDDAAGMDAREVAVEVRTQPPGARVKVDGREVCAATPCRFHAARGALLRVATRKPGFRLETVALTPSNDPQRVELVLEPLPYGRAGNHMQGDLMLPDAFGKP